MILKQHKKAQVANIMNLLVAIILIVASGNLAASLLAIKAPSGAFFLTKKKTQYIPTRYCTGALVPQCAKKQKNNYVQLRRKTLQVSLYLGKMGKAHKMSPRRL